MVDGRVFYHDLDPKLTANIDLWNFLKKEIFSPSAEKRKADYSENVQINSYELDSELKEDIESVKEVTGGLENLGQSGQYNNSTS